MPIPDTGSSRYPYYVLFALGLVNMFNYVDRHIVSVLLVPIQQDFQVSDEWMGILTGLAFVVAHSLFGLPLARLADRTTRRTVVAAGVAVWSALTALCGLAQSFWQLVVLRMGVGIGEAAGAPPSHSLISDYFGPERRATALAIFSTGVYAGIMFGYFAAGWIGESLGWRLTFVVVGLPGLALAWLVHATVREPPRSPVEASETFVDVVRYLFRRRAYLALLFAASCHAIAAYGAVVWTPTFLSRVHGMTLFEVGTGLGLISGLGGACGALAGGAIADRLGRGDARWNAWVAAIAAFSAVPCAALYLRADGAVTALLWYLPYIMVVGAYNGPLHAMNQGLARPRMRAMAVAIHLMVVNLLGGGIGPWVVGRMNDALHPQFGDLAIRQSMLMVICIGSALAGIGYLITSVSLRRDLATAQGH